MRDGVAVEGSDRAYKVALSRRPTDRAYISRRLGRTARAQSYGLRPVLDLGYMRVGG